MEEKQMKVVEMSGNTVNQGVWDILKEMKTVLIGSKGTVEGEIGTAIKITHSTCRRGKRMY